jgi:putative chitinase
MINRKFFFDQVNLRLFDRKLPAKARASLDQILDYWEKNHSKNDDRWLAYALGTAHHETDRTFGPIREYGRGKGKKYYPYYGRGLVQLTWDYNYKKMSPVVGVDLVKNPDRALDLKNAIPIMFVGMTQGIFTGKICRLFQQDQGGLGQRPKDHQRPRQGKPHRRLRQEILRHHQLHYLTCSRLRRSHARRARISCI